MGFCSYNPEQIHKNQVFTDNTFKVANTLTTQGFRTFVQTLAAIWGVGQPTN